MTDTVDTESNSQKTTESTIDLRELITSNPWYVVSALLAVGAAVILLGFDIEVPRFWYLFGLSGLVVLPYGWIVGGKIADWIVDPNHVWVVDLEADELAKTKIFLFPGDDFAEMEVIDGDVDRVTPNIVFAKEVDKENQTMKGVWSGSITDREMLREREKIKACRGILEDDAKVGFTLQTRFWHIVRGATTETVLDVIETFEGGALPDDGVALDKYVEDAVSHYDMDDTPGRERQFDLGDAPTNLDQETDESDQAVDHQEAAADD